MKIETRNALNPLQCEPKSSKLISVQQYTRSVDDGVPSDPSSSIWLLEQRNPLRTFVTMSTLAVLVL